MLVHITPTSVKASKHIIIYLPHVPHDRVFLSVDEALEHDSNGHVHIIIVDVFSQVHASVGLGRTYDGLDVTNCDRDTTSSLRE